MPSIARRLLPLLVLASAGIGSAAWTAYRTVAPHPVATLASPVPENPYRERIAATGLIETRDEDTIVGVPESRLVAEVTVAVGDKVVPGQLLFRLDDRALRADLLVAEAERQTARCDLAAARAEVERLEAGPRPEDALPIAARIPIAEAELADAQTHLARSERLLATKATPAADRDLRLGAEHIARANLARAQADLAHARLGAWAPDLAVARAAVATAEARAAAAEARAAAIGIRVDCLAIRSARAATVLACRVTAGSAAVPGDTGLMRLGDADHLRVRAEIDESQARRIDPRAPGRAWIRGDPAAVATLAFVRIEPLAEVRQALPGAPGERLDARAVQVLYDLVSPPAHFRPGVLLEIDVSTEATP